MKHFSELLDQNQAELLNFISERLPIDDEISYVDFALMGSNSSRYVVGYAKLNSTEDLGNVLFSLPSNSQNVLLAFTHNHMSEVARLLGNLEEYEADTGRKLSVGDVVVTPETVGQKILPFAVIFLPVAVSGDCARLRDQITIGGKLTSFHLVVPLTKKEWSLWKTQGYDALIEMFESNDKSFYM